MVSADGPEVRQAVRAEGGFAYGAVGADIHVFGDGVPVYLLENLPPAPDASDEFLRELPSRMLNARFQVVEFVGRDAELADLRAWRDQQTPLAVRWLHGPGGQGKTRLADRFARQSQAQGWKVVRAVHGPGTAIPPPGSQDLRLSGAEGLLLIVDYADRWPVSHLTWLFSNALLHRPGVRCRVLMLARDINSWPSIRAALANHQANTSAQALTPLPGTEPRAEMFGAACRGFASCYGIGPPPIPVPTSLAEPDFGLTLTVHMAALVAVDAHVRGQSHAADVAGLTVYLLDREHLHWRNLYGDAHHELPGADPGFRTPPDVMNRTVFTAAITGAQPDATAVEFVRATQQDGRPERIVADHARCYPPADPGFGLEPLYPDRLAEDFLALTVPGHAADYPAQPWAGPTARTVLGPDTAARAITFLAAGAQRWSHVGPELLFPLLRADPALALTSSAALVALADVPNVEAALLAEIASRFPSGRHADLDPGIAAITERLTPHLLAHADDPGARGEIYTNLSIRLADAGRFDEALSAARRAMRIYREHAQRFPAELAGTIGNVGNRLAAVGRRDEALAHREESVAIWRRVAAANPKEHELDLADALSSLGNQLADVGRRMDALTASTSAVAIYRRAAARDVRVYGPKFGEAVGNLGADLASAGNADIALQHSREALHIWRRLAEIDPPRYQVDLAKSLGNLGADLADLGQFPEALHTTRESVELWQRLAKANPLAHDLDLAKGLGNLGLRLLENGRRDEAVPPLLDSVARLRRLAETNPGAYRPDLALALVNLCGMYAELGQDAHAIEVGAEAVPLTRGMEAANAEAYRPLFARALNSMAVALWHVGRLDEAHAAASEAVELRRRLAKINPDQYEPFLAKSLRLLAYIGQALNQAADSGLYKSIGKKLGGWLKR